MDIPSRNSATTHASDTVARLIADYTPRRLTAEEWALAGPHVRALVTSAGPRSVDQAGGFLSQLTGFLTDPQVWDRQAAPDWDRLFAPHVIAAHARRAIPASPATRSPRQAVLNRLARVHGSAAPLVKRPSRNKTSDPYLTPAATWDVPLADLVGTRRTLEPPMAIEVLRPIVERLEARSSIAVAARHATAFTTAANTPVSNMTNSPSAPNSSTAGPGKLSRRAQLAHAKAAQKATQQAKAAKHERQTVGIQLPDGSALDEATRDAVRKYTPLPPNDRVWERNRALLTAMVFAYGPSFPKQGRTIGSYLAAYATWLATRDGRDPAALLTVEELLDPRPVEVWLDECGWVDSSLSSVRTALRRINKRLNPDDVPISLPYRPALPPYSPEECDRLVRLAWHQPSDILTRDICIAVALGLGAGLDASDLRPLTRQHITTILIDTGTESPVDEWFVTVPGHGARARTVPIRRQYVPLLQRGLDLHKKTRQPDDLLLGKIKDRNNALGHVRERAVTAEGNQIEFRMSRLRNTWLVAMLCAPISLADLLPVAGLKSARIITDLVAHCPAPDEERRRHLADQLRKAGEQS